MFSEQQETIIETLSGMMLNNINEVWKHVESVKAKGEKAEANLRKVFAERELVEDRFRTKMEEQLTKLSGMDAQLREGIDQNAAIHSSLLEMGKQIATVQEANARLTEMVTATAADTAAAVKHMLAIDEKIASPLAAEFVELKKFTEKFTAYRRDILSKMLEMEARWTPLLSDVKKVEGQLRTEMVERDEAKDKELKEVKDRLEAVENFLLERKEKADLKRALRESSGHGSGVGEGQSSQPLKRRRLVKMSEKVDKVKSAEEELEALHEEAFLADLETRRMEEKDSHKMIKLLGKQGKEVDVLDSKQKKMFIPKKVIAKPVVSKKKQSRKGKKPAGAEAEEDFILPHNTDGYVDDCCPPEKIEEWKAAKRDFICSYYVCKSIGIGATANETFFAWMEERHSDLWAEILKASVKFKLNLQAPEFEKIPTPVTADGKFDQLSVRRTLKICFAEVSPPIGTDNRELYDRVYEWLNVPTGFRRYD